MFNFSLDFYLFPKIFLVYIFLWLVSLCKDHIFGSYTLKFSFSHLVVCFDSILELTFFASIQLLEWNYSSIWNDAKIIILLACRYSILYFRFYWNNLGFVKEKVHWTELNRQERFYFKLLQLEREIELNYAETNG